MKVLVLGSEGVIGKSLCGYLEHRGHIVFPWDIKLDILHDLSNPLNIPGLKNCVDEVDFVFFLAYDVGGAKYIWNTDTDFINRNVAIMMNTFSVLKNKPFIFASSTMYNMHNAYGTLKYLGEHYTSKLGGLSVRFWNVYGLEAVSDKSHVLTDIIDNYRHHGYVQLLSSGEEERQFLHTFDCAKGLEVIMNNYETIKKTESSVDLSSFEWTKIKDLAHLVCDNVRTTPTELRTHDRKNDPRPFILQYWQPTITLREGVASLLLLNVDCISSSIPVLQASKDSHEDPHSSRVAKTLAKP